MNKQKIIQMLEYCGESYHNCQSEEKDTTIITIDDHITDVQCFLRLSKGTLTIVFRGSDSRKDWNTNFKFWKSVIPYKNYNSKIRVHAGFIGAYKSLNVRGKIHKFVTDDVKKICVTGHSYGAALAILCAIDLEYNFPKKDYEVIVFGCPRVGNKAFQESYNLRIFKTLRVETKGDVISKIPFAFLGYRHVGAVLKLRKNITKSLFRKHTLQEYYSKIWDV